MDKSKILSFVMQQAEKLKEADGRKSLNANYFLLGLIEAYRLQLAKNLPDELNNASAKIELMIAVRQIDKYGVDKEVLAKAISEGMKSADYNPSTDDFIFDKFGYNAEAKAKANGKNLITIADYLELIIAEPTELIKANLIKETKSAASAPATETAEEEEDSDSSGVSTIFSDFFEEPKKKKASSSSAKKKAEPAPVGMAGVSSLVATTAKIQKFLLDNIFGQDLAVNTFVSGYFQSEMMNMSKISKGKPKATFLFAGPPGVGKTFLAEKAAEALELPFMRFDMSEYADKEANIEFCGSDKVYKNGKAGNVTSFVSDNPKCVLLFDEIEKAHLVVTHLFLQILDAGRLRDNYTDEEVSFENAIIIFTTNVGKNLYNDPTVTNLSALPRKQILTALEKDKQPGTDVPLFPQAICSRFASGNVVMFNHLLANNLYVIANRELSKNIKAFEKTSKMTVELDPKVATAIMLSEGGKADARTVKGRSSSFFYDELYELFRLLGTPKYAGSVEGIETVKINVKLDGSPDTVKKLFVGDDTPAVLVFADAALCESCKAKLPHVKVFSASDLETAKEILFREDISVVLCDVKFGAVKTEDDLLNAEDVKSVGADFLSYVLTTHSIHTYLLQEKDGDITDEEFLSFAKQGVIGLLTMVSKTRTAFEKSVIEKCDVAYQQGNMIKLARENKLVTYKTSQTISQNRKTATINLFDFRLSLATDSDDAGNILDSVSKPNLHFEDVIGAPDAKRELAYFVEYLKNPMKYMRRGLRAPKGILLYGPPGTGKTMLAKAMAGESDVTFITAEGNQFLKRFVGEGPDAVHALFNTARKYAPSILFIDEIDAIGKNRNANSTVDTSDVLTAFLTEMDGFNTDTTKPVFVLAATNFTIEQTGSKSLDPALLRRFDRKILVDLPDKDERKKFLELKLKKNPALKISAEQIENTAIRSTGMSLAELDSVIEFALRNAAASESGEIGDVAFEEAFETYTGGEKKEWSEDTLRRTARHEAGHALLCWLSGDKPSYVTVVARGNHGGYMQHGDNEDKTLYTRAELLSLIRVSLAGRAAEIAYYGDEEGITTGASSDIRHATKVAEQMICDYGMDAEMGIPYMDENALPSEYYTRVHDRIRALLDEELENAVEIITKNKYAIDLMVDELLVKNHLKGNEIDEIFRRSVTD